VVVSGSAVRDKLYLKMSVWDGHLSHANMKQITNHLTQFSVLVQWNGRLDRLNRLTDSTNTINVSKPVSGDVQISEQLYL